MNNDLTVKVEDVVFNYRVGIMIQKNDKILLEFNPKIDYCVIPGGRVKILESSLETIKREIKEEMHVDLIDEELKLKSFIENFFEMDNKKYHELYLLYKINVNEYDKRFDNVKINYDSESNYYDWVNINDLDKVNLLPIVLRSLSKDNSFEHVIHNDLKEKTLSK